ncbi:MAG: hypothetical protein GWP08_17160 [Nitrospiraceae bacterium]|nr:hypothetical protein [Nitrospiraceae bacterium]
MVYLDVADAKSTAERLAQAGVLVGTSGPTRLRAVFHLDVDDNGLDRVVAAFEDVFGT